MGYGLVGSIYESILGDDSENQLSRTLADHLDSPSCSVYAIKGGDIVGMSLHNVGQELNDKYSEHFHAIDPWLQGGLRLAEMRAASTERFVSTEAYFRSEFYNDLMRQTGNAGYCMGAHLSAESLHVSIAAMRHVRHRGYGVDDEDRFQDLLPHVRRAFVTRARLDDQATEIDQLQTLLNQDDAIWLVDRKMNIQWRNDAAGGHTVDPTRFSAELVQAVALATACPPISSSIVVAGYRCFIDPVAQRPGMASVARMTIVDDEALRQRRIAAAAARYGLTLAEQRLCLSLAAGLSVTTHAERSHIATSTSRSHLKHVMSKTGTIKQTQLLSLINGLTP